MKACENMKNALETECTVGAALQGAAGLAVAVRDLREGVHEFALQCDAKDLEQKLRLVEDALVS